jgi:VWFA-related protein
MFTKNNLLLFSLAVVFWAHVLPGQDQQEKLLKRLEYEVSVNAQLIPLFAVDSRGEPVYDLKKDEIELEADGKTVEIIYFAGYRVEEESAQLEESPKRPAVPGLERINFIILDTLISNKNTLVPAQAIALGIIRQAAPGEAFVILESNQISGLQYVIGPEKNKNKLFHAVQGIVKRYMRRRVWLTQKMPRPEDYSDPKSYELALQMFGSAYREVQREREQYQKDIRIFADSLQQLKYALKTITQPKTIYLVSAGLIPGAMGNSATYYGFLEDAAKAINYGGSMFYLINPLRQKSPGEGTELEFMTEEVGGKLITGTSTADIIKKIKKSTSAYYELVYSPEKKSGQQNRLTMKCKRDNVELITIHYIEQRTPYPEMDRLEQKLFVLNIVNDGSWSRMAAKVEIVDYRTLDSPDPRFTAIEVPIPPAMRNKMVDLFLVNIDLKTEKAEVQLQHKIVDKIEQIRFQVHQDMKQYFVFIEPQRLLCIYNRISLK